MSPGVLRIGIAAAVVLLALAAFGALWSDLQGERTAHAGTKALLAKVRQQHAEAVADAASAALAQSQRYRQLEDQMRTQAKEAEDALSRERAANDRRVAAARADGMRDGIATAATAPAAGGTCEAAAEEFRARAATLGDLLGAVVQVADDHTAAAELHAAEVRRLLRSEATVTCGGS